MTSITGCIPVIQALLWYRADVDAKNNTGQTPLRNASFYDYMDAMEELIYRKCQC